MKAEVCPFNDRKRIKVIALTHRFSRRSGSLLPLVRYRGGVYRILQRSDKFIKGIRVNHDRTVSTFYIGKTKISSDCFKVSETGSKDSRITGTLGADILEDRKTLISFKDRFIIFNLAEEPASFKNNLIGFKFKRRKIIVHGLLNGKEENSCIIPGPVFTNC